MKRMDNILEQNAGRSGMTVPDGYFADFAERMARALPEQPWERAESALEAGESVKRSLWQKVRPYVYMAAMFAGVWCMMKMFDLSQSASQDLSISARPELAQALSDPQFTAEYLYDSTDYDTENDLMDTLYESGFDPTEVALN